MTINTKGMGGNQKAYLSALCEMPVGITLPWCAFGDTAATEGIGISLARRGLVDGPAERPAWGYAEHTINQEGRQWVHDNISQISGHRWTLTGEEVPREEYVRYLDHCMAVTINESEAKVK